MIASHPPLSSKHVTNEGGKKDVEEAPKRSCQLTKKTHPPTFRFYLNTIMSVMTHPAAQKVTKESLYLCGAECGREGPV